MGLIPGPGSPHVPRSSEAHAPHLLSPGDTPPEPVVWGPGDTAPEARTPWSNRRRLSDEREAHASHWRVAATHHSWRRPARSSGDPAQPKAKLVTQK